MLCELCDYASNFAEHYLEKNGTEDKVVSGRGFIPSLVLQRSSLPASMRRRTHAQGPRVLELTF